MSQMGFYTLLLIVYDEHGGLFDLESRAPDRWFR
jgi:hypothetical protein